VKSRKPATGDHSPKVRTPSVSRAGSSAGSQPATSCRRVCPDRLRLGAGALVATLLTACLVCSAAQLHGGNVSAATRSGRSSPLQLGVTVFSMWRDWDNHGALLEQARGTGSGWLRADFGWCSLEEAGPGKISLWYQGRLDVTAAAAERLGMQLLVQIGCAPTWAGGTGYNSYPQDPAQFQRVAHYLATRYKGKVAAWEIWNEPNCIGGCSNGSPQQFVNILKAGYQGIKTADPHALVISGGVSGNDADWIKKMYAAGAHGHFDALAVHPYQDPANTPPNAPSQDNKYRLTSLPLVRAQMIHNGDANKPIWLTEFGWTTANTGPRIGVNPTTQAHYLQQAINLIHTTYPYVTHAFWYCLRDRDDSTPYENNFGLLYLDGTPKPAYTALQQTNATPGTIR
jgi:polysaccharide biosynthesis protein PslG